MKTRAELKTEMFKIIDAYIMKKTPNIDFTKEDRSRLLEIKVEMDRLNDLDTQI